MINSYFAKFLKVVIVVWLFFVSSFLVGMNYQKRLLSKIIVPNVIPFPTPQSTYQPKVQVISTSPDGRRQLILRPKEDVDFDLVLKTEEVEKVIDQVMYVKEVVWSPGGTQIAFSSGGASLGYTVKIVNLETGQKISTQEQSVLFNHLKGSYSHVYSRVLEWRENNQLLIVVSALGDTESDKDFTQYYLIDTITGKVVRKLL